MSIDEKGNCEKCGEFASEYGQGLNHKCNTNGAVKMNIYLISQDQNANYDTYDSAVVVAPDEVTARKMHPSGCQDSWVFSSWCKSPYDVTVKLIGKACNNQEVGVICASFNAG